MDLDALHLLVASDLKQPLDKTNNDFNLAGEKLAASALSHKVFNVSAFAECMQIIGLSTDELFRQYVGKNVLNFFRQDNGYKNGSYIKEWHGKEDNEVLVEILAKLDPSNAEFKSLVYSELEAAYPG